MTNACIIISMLWATIGFATAYQATAQADWFVTVRTVSQCQFATKNATK